MVKHMLLKIQTNISMLESAPTYIIAPFNVWCMSYSKAFGYLVPENIKEKKFKGKLVFYIWLSDGKYWKKSNIIKTN